MRWVGGGGLVKKDVPVEFADADREGARDSGGDSHHGGGGVGAGDWGEEAGEGEASSCLVSISYRECNGGEAAPAAMEKSNGSFRAFAERVVFASFCKERDGGGGSEGVHPLLWWPRERHWWVDQPGHCIYFTIEASSFLPPWTFSPAQGVDTQQTGVPNLRKASSIKCP